MWMLHERYERSYGSDHLAVPGPTQGEHGFRGKQVVGRWSDLKPVHVLASLAVRYSAQVDTTPKAEIRLPFQAVSSKTSKYTTFKG